MEVPFLSGIEGHLPVSGIFVEEDNYPHSTFRVLGLPPQGTGIIGKVNIHLKVISILLFQPVDSSVIRQILSWFCEFIRNSLWCS